LEVSLKDESFSNVFLLYESFITESNTTINTWYSFIGNIFKKLDLEIIDFENFTRPFASYKTFTEEKKLRK
jgi:hypothetical protein